MPRLTHIIWIAVPVLALSLQARAAEEGADPVAIAREFMNLPADGRASALEPSLLSRYRSQSNGVTHLCFRQHAAGVPIFKGEILVNVGPDGRILNCHGRFENDTEIPVAKPRRLTPEAALHLVAELVDRAEADFGKKLPDDGTRFLFSGGELSRRPIRLEKVWFRQADGSLVPAWETRILTNPETHLWHLVIADDDGRELHRSDLACRAGSYRVPPLPLGSPDEGPLELITDQEDQIASPFGWHDTNGIAGAEFTDTRGNNIVAQEDSNGNDSGGTRPSGGNSLVFDYPPNPALGSLANRNASIVNAFYVANICHDLFYHYGFNEAAGNFQQSNYNRSGLGGDAIQLDTEDSFSVGNAAFFPSVDGEQAQMEFGIEPPASILTITSPESLAGVIASEGAIFGPRTGGAGIDSAIVAAIDTANAEGPSIFDCCSPPTNPEALAGKIALIDRGECTFVDKVLNAQNAGAIAVIVANNEGDEVIEMGGSGTGITIPSIFVGQSDGEAIRAALAEGVTCKLMIPSQGINYALDSGIVIHEYGHGITTRLTGGPAIESCLSETVGRGLGEGWSDFFALVLTAKPSDTPATPKKIGGFIDPPAGFRSVPYSTDRTINPLTYADIVPLDEVHDIGEIWCSVLWDLHWDLVRHYGFSTDLRAPHTAGGNNLALQLVTDALKLQPCEASFTDARDAVLLADLALTGGVNGFGIWNTFARRGLGENATKGEDGNDTTIEESFAVPADLDLADTDNDGLVNLLDVALGGNYLSSDTAIRPVALTVTVGPDTFPAIRYRRLAGGSGTTGQDYSVDGISYLPETSADLGGFTSGPGVFAVVAVEAAEVTGVEFVTLRTTIPVDDSVTQYLRLRVTRSSD